MHLRPNDLHIVTILILCNLDRLNTAYGMDIFVSQKNYPLNQHAIAVDASTTIGDVKSIIASQQIIEPETISLTYNLQDMHPDTMSLADFGVCSEAGNIEWDYTIS